MSIVSSKSCTLCSEMKPLTEYHKDALTKDGLKSKCKICRLADNAKYFAENRESVAAVQLAYHEKNKEARNAYQREWREKNKEAASAYNKEYRKNNQDKFAVNARRRRARILGNRFEKYTEAQVLELYGIDCHLCMEPIDMDAPRSTGIPGWERGLHFDHVIALVNGGSDTLDNVKPSHGLCNLRKYRN